MIPEIEAAREELQRAAEETSSREIQNQLKGMNQALNDFRELDDEPKADRVKEIRAELSRLEADAEGTTQNRIDRIRGHLRDLETEQR